MDAVSELLILMLLHLQKMLGLLNRYLLKPYLVIYTSLCHLRKVHACNGSDLRISAGSLMIRQQYDGLSVSRHLDGSESYTVRDNV